MSFLASPQLQLEEEVGAGVEIGLAVVVIVVIVLGAEILGLFHYKLKKERRNL